MRGKVGPNTASLRDTRGNVHNNTKARENNNSKVIKPILKPTKTPTGKGLGKAGAKRLGRLLKRAIQVQEEESAVKGKAALPKTPVRLFKYQVQKETENAPNTKPAKPASSHISQLILSVVCQCKHRGGISMAELKHTLAAGGYDVTKNNKKVNVVTKRLVNNDKIVRTTRNASFRLNSKTDTKQARTGGAIPMKTKGDLKQNKSASKSPKGKKKSQRPARRTTKHKGKSNKPKGKAQKAAARPHKPKGKTRKPAAKSHKPRRKTLKARGKTAKPAGKKRGSATSRAAQVRKTPRKTTRTRRRRPKQNRLPYKSSRIKKPRTRQRLTKTRLRKAPKRRVAVRRTYYY
nr:histone H1.01-like [Labrus bergylta]